MTKKLLFLLSIYFIAYHSFSQTFADAVVIDANAGFDPYEIASGDLDGDGDMDIVMATYNITGPTPRVDNIKWYKNDGSGNFTVEAVVSSTITAVDGLIVANIDNQNGLDIVATSANQNKLVYFLSDGSGGFGAEVVVDNIAGPGAVVSGDINLDGHTDLVTMSYDNNATYWYSGDGTGNFTKETDVENGTSDGPYFTAVGDIDGDTDLDVIVGFFNTQTIELYYNQYIESGTMTVSWVQDSETVDSGNAYLFEIDIADVNNDGNMEIIKLDNSSGEVAWYEKPKDAASTEHVISNSAIIGRPGAFAVADVDNDTFNDVIVSNANTGSANPGLIWFKGSDNADPSTTPTTIATSSKQFFDITAANFDSDNDLDIATVGRGTDTVDWFENELESLSIEGQGLNEFKLYPNPTNDFLNLKGPSQIQYEVSIVDTIGKVVQEQTLGTNERMDVSHLRNGIYIIKIKNYDASLKFVKS